MDVLVECFSSKLKGLSQTSLLPRNKQTKTNKQKTKCYFLGSLIFLMIEFN
jgi:hypothetical protein